QIMRLSAIDLGGWHQEGAWLASREFDAGHGPCFLRLLDRLVDTGPWSTRRFEGIVRPPRRKQRLDAGAHGDCVLRGGLDRDHLYPFSPRFTQFSSIRQ